MMVLETFCSWPGEALYLNMHWTYVTPSPENICVGSVFVNFSKIFISSCRIIPIFFYQY